MDFTYPLYLAYSGGLYRKPNIDEKVKISRSEKLHFGDSLHYIKLVKELIGKNENSNSGGEDLWCPLLINFHVVYHLGSPMFVSFGNC